MTEAFLVDGVRTPIGRYGGALAAVRPDDLAAHVAARAHPAAAVGGLVRGRRRRARLRQPGRRGQPQRRADGAAAGRAARDGVRHDREPAVRLGRRRGGDRGAGGAGGRGRPRGRGRCREHEPRAVRDGEGAVGVRPVGGRARHHAGLAVREPGDGAALRHRLDGRDRRERRRRSGTCPRADQDAFALRSQERAAKAVGLRAAGGGHRAGDGARPPRRPDGRRAPTSTRGPPAWRRWRG